MKKYLASFAAFLMLVVAVPVLAQDQAPPPPDQDQQNEYPGWDTNQPPNQPNQPPDQQADQDNQAQPGMARLSYVHGDVSSQRGDNGDWVAATVNTPIAVNDRVATGNNARAEIQLDYADVLRMSANATAKIANLTRTGVTVQIGQGLVSYSVLRGSEANPEIDTPNSAIHPNGPGEYRILVNSDAETQVIVRGGSADVSTPQGSTRVDEGQMITIAGTDNPQYKTAAAPGRDEWDSWNNDRDRNIESAKSWHHTDRYYTGTEDLDNHGVWSEVPDYGPVWVPEQGPDWAPYRDGRWVYEPYYGWTWVSYEPWGWAPYHYGRWFVYGGNWVWWPGPVVAYPAYYPIWSPAYVSFIGFGGGVGFGFGFGNVGWYPCGPFDPFFPWYGSFGFGFRTFAFGDFGRFRDFDRFHDRDIDRFRDRFRGGDRDRFSNANRMFNDARTRGGVSSMSSRDFGRTSVSMRQSPLSAGTLRQSSLIGGRVGIAPSRESFSPSGRAANPASYRNAPPTSQRFFNNSAARANAGINSRQSSFGPGRNAGSVQRQSGQTPARESPQNRGGQTMNSNPANASGAVQSGRGGWQTFTPRSGASNDRGSAVNPARGNFGQPESRGSNESRPSLGGAENQNRDSWQHFTPPPSRQSQAQSQGYGRGYSESNGSTRGYQPSERSSGGGYYNSGSRPPLNMRQPIVTPRGDSRGGYYGGRGYNAPQPSYSAPRGGYPGGGYSGGRSYSAPRPSYSAPRGGYSGGAGGGGGYRGGGGGGGGSRGGGGGGGGSRGGGGGGGGNHSGGHGR